MTPDPETGESASVSQLLAECAAQDPRALDRLGPLGYEELRRLAHYHMRGERAAHTLQTTALVNKVYLRLAGIKRLQWRDSHTSSRWWGRSCAVFSSITLGGRGETSGGAACR
jgi:hypothetical protein